ncbi:MAG: hypothetical protein WBA77_18195 [Microcoleaceae cyanobacterium]
MNFKLNAIKRDYQLLFISLLTGLSTIIAITAISFPSLAQINLAVLLEILGGENEVFIEDQVAQESDDAALGEEVRTEDARAQLSFNNGAAGRIDQNTSIVVGQCIEVEQGAIVASGPANGCLSDFAVGVEGTIYLMQIDQDNIGQINVLEGEVLLRRQDNLENPNPLTIEAGQKVVGLAQDLALENVVIEPMTKEEYIAIITGPLFQDYQDQLPDEDKINQVCERLYEDCLAVGSEPPQTATEAETPIRGLW